MSANAPSVRAGHVASDRLIHDIVAQRKQAPLDKRDASVSLQGLEPAEPKLTLSQRERRLADLNCC